MPLSSQVGAPCPRPAVLGPTGMDSEEAAARVTKKAPWRRPSESPRRWAGKCAALPSDWLLLPLHPPCLLLFHRPTQHPMPGHTRVGRGAYRGSRGPTPGHTRAGRGAYHGSRGSGLPRARHCPISETPTLGKDLAGGTLGRACGDGRGSCAASCPCGGPRTRFLLGRCLETSPRASWMDLVVWTPASGDKMQP